MDSKNQFSIFFQRTFPEILNRDIDCIALGRVIKYYKKKHEADVQPLPLDSDGNKRTPFNYCVVPYSIYYLDKCMVKLTTKRTYPVKGGPGHIDIDDIPVKHGAFPKWKPMQVGSLVIVGACDREIDNLNTKTKNNYKIGTKRMHSFNDSVILGVVTP